MGMGHQPVGAPASPPLLSNGRTGDVLAGPFAAMPAASWGNVGWLYLAVDQAGGTLYRSNGAAWVQCGAGVTLTLPNTGTPGTYGQVTTDAQGRVTAGATCDAAHGGTGVATLTAHAVLLGEGTGTVGFATIGTGGRLLVDQGAGADPAFEVMSGDATLAAGGALTLKNTGTAGTYGDGSHVAQITTDAQGRITAVAAVAVTYPGAATLMNGRIGLTSGTAVAGDLSNATTLYLNAYKGNQIGLNYAGGGYAPYSINVASPPSLPVTQTQNGTPSNGLFTITGLTDTSQLVRGMSASGTGVGAAAVINSIDSATQITLSVASTSSPGSTPIIFNLPASIGYDIYAVPTGASTFRLQFGNAWNVNGLSRTDAVALDGSGIYSNTSAINAADSNAIAAGAGRYLGSLYTDSAHKATDAGQERYLWNYYNRVPRKLLATESTASWTYALAAWRQARASTSNFVDVFIGMPEEPVELTVEGTGVGSATYYPSFGIGLGSTTVNSADTWSMNSDSGAVNAAAPLIAKLKYLQPIGYMRYYWLETAGAAATAVYYSGGGVGFGQAGMSGVVNG